MERNQKLVEKVQEINEIFQHKFNKPQSTDNLANKLAQIDRLCSSIRKKMDSMMQKNCEELQALKAKSIELFHEAEQSNEKYEQEASQQMEEIEMICEQVNQKMEIEGRKRKERQHNMLAAFDQKMQILKNEIDKERKCREDLLSQVASTLEEDVPTMMEDLAIGKQELKKQLCEVNEEFEGRMQENQQEVEIFSQGQKENEEKAFKLIRDLTKKVKEELEEQREICQATHEEILTYVEETCNRLSEQNSQ